AATLKRLVRLYPGVRFVWLMGADNLATLHRWQRWGDIMATVPVGVLARPGQRLAARRSVAARVHAAARLPEAASRLLAGARCPAWCFVNLPMTDISSTRIRNAGGWRAGA
ncbi:MAG: nicotinic acid mononucleotide adenylyltransferase, partial [Thermohalobaculum sp.]|nr:nicotinic acid mononucleotide adenylyltransferase [Thermohalobaculum sp.]